MANWSQPATAELKVDLRLDSNGFIVVDPTVSTAATKGFTLKGFVANGTFANAETLFRAILTDIVGAKFNAMSTIYTERRSVVDDG